MKKRFSVEQITAVLQQAAQGVPVGDLCRKVGISEQTFYRWKKVYGSLQPSEARELKQLRDVQHNLRKDIDALGDRLAFINIALVPLLVAIFAIGLAAFRRRRRAHAMTL